MNQEKKDVVLSLCSGIGAFEFALRDFMKPGTKVYFSEISQNAIGVYKEHFSEAQELGDITQISEETITKIVQGTDRQFVFAGFPCQNISMANNVTRRGLKGAKSSLFYEVIRIIECIQRAKTTEHRVYVIIENVKGDKQTHQEITDTLQKTLNKDRIHKTIFDSSEFSAQARQRVFWTNFPVTTLDKKHYINPNQLILRNALSPVQVVMQKAPEIMVSDKFITMYNKIMNETPCPQTITARKVENFTRVPFSIWTTEITQGQPRARWQKYPFSDSAQPKSKTITTNHPNYHIIDRRFGEGEGQFIVRQFLAEELEFLFCFPQGWTAKRDDGCKLSNRERIELLGNSIVTSVIREILAQSQLFN
jgi:DNA-cytosine methyltransferase